MFVSLPHPNFAPRTHLLLPALDRTASYDHVIQCWLHIHLKMFPYSKWFCSFFFFSHISYIISTASLSSPSEGSPRQERTREGEWATRLVNNIQNSTRFAKHCNQCSTFVPFFLSVYGFFLCFFLIWSFEKLST